MSYTPTRSTVRGRYAGVGESASPQARAEFDRWEAKVIRTAKELAWDELYSTQYDGAPLGHLTKDPNNPYREAST